jgi:hypothetical protein
MSAITSSSPQVNAVIPSKEEVDPASAEVSALMENSCSLLVSQDQKMEQELAKVKQAHEVAKKEWENSYVALAEENRQLKVQAKLDQGRIKELESTHQGEINAFREALKASNERRAWFEIKFKQRDYQVNFMREYNVHWCSGMPSKACIIGQTISAFSRQWANCNRLSNASLLA